jgi:hypothetical protein
MMVHMAPSRPKHAPRGQTMCAYDEGGVHTMKEVCTWHGDVHTMKEVCAARGRAYDEGGVHVAGNAWQGEVAHFLTTRRVLAHDGAAG